MENFRNRVGLNIWFGLGVGLAGGGIFLTLVWTGHLTALVLVASSARANDPGLDLLNQYLSIIKNLSCFSFVTALVCVAVGFWKLRKSKHL